MLGATVHAFAQPAITIEIYKGSMPLMLNDINKLSEGRYCVAGSLFDESKPAAKAVTYVVSTKTNEVKAHTPPPTEIDYAQSTSLSCGEIAGKSFSILSFDTNLAQSLNQNFLYIAQLNPRSDPLKSIPLPPGKVYFENLKLKNKRQAQITAKIIDEKGAVIATKTSIDKNLRPTTITFKESSSSQIENSKNIQKSKEQFIKQFDDETIVITTTSTKDESIYTLSIERGR